MRMHALSMAICRRAQAALYVIAFVLLLFAFCNRQSLQHDSVSLTKRFLSSGFTGNIIETQQAEPMKKTVNKLAFSLIEPTLIMDATGYILEWNAPAKSTRNNKRPKLKKENKEDAKQKLDKMKLKWEIGPADSYALATYPAGGTGVTVNISKAFDPNVFDSFCDTDMPLRAVIPVYSYVGRFEFRNVMRMSLGKWARKLNCKLFFICGVSLNQTVNMQLQREYKQNKDILVMSKLDSYRDLNDKAVVMVEWLSQHCTHVPYVIHHIDDAFVNIEMFLARMDSVTVSNYMFGGLMKGLRTPRNIKLHTFLTKKEYPDAVLPTFLIGFAYSFPMNVSRLLLAAAYRARYCWIEDIWFTGMVREAAHVQIIPMQRSEWRSNENKPIPHLLDGLPPYFMIHSIEPELFPKLYKSTTAVSD